MNSEYQDELENEIGEIEHYYNNDEENGRQIDIANTDGIKVGKKKNGIAKGTVLKSK